MDTIRPGLTGEHETIVRAELTATALGSGNVPVYATPALVALMEAAAVAAIAALLPEGQTSVGVEIDLKHLAATPPGQPVRARAEVTAVDERSVDFSIQAWDAHELIGEATHRRVIVDIDRFMRRVDGKRGS